MRRRIFWVVIGLPLALITSGAGAALCLPPVRHAISGLWHIPDRLPALSADNPVRYELGAENFARTTLSPLWTCLRRSASQAQA